MKKILSILTVILLLTQFGVVNASYNDYSLGMFCKVTKSNAYTGIYNMTLLPGLQKYSFIASNTDGKFLAVQEGVEHQEYEGVYNITYSSDFKSFTYLAKKDNGKFVMVQDGVESGEYTAIKEFQFTDSTYLSRYIDDITQSNTLAFVAEKENGKIVFVSNNIESEEYTNIEMLASSFDGKSIAYEVIEENGMHSVIKDDIKYGEYIDIYDLQYSLNGESFSFVGKNDNNTFVIVRNGIVSDEEVSIFGRYHSENGEDFAYITSNYSDNTNTHQNVFGYYCSPNNATLLDTQKVNAKKYLSLRSSSKKYIDQIDSLVGKLSEEKLKKLQIKLPELQEKLSSKSGNKVNILKNLISYFEVQVIKEIQKREEN